MLYSMSTNRLKMMNFKQVNQYLKICLVIDLLLNVAGTCLATNSTCNNHETCLIKRLLDPERYSPAARPVINPSDQLNVNFRLKLNVLDEIDVRHEIMAIRGLVTLKWCDKFLTWNPEEYDGLDKIALNPENIWIPQIVLFNSAGEVTAMKEMGSKFKVQVDKDGQVSWYFSGLMVTQCRVSIVKFPFDTQVCTMKIGNWGYKRNLVDLNFYKEGINTDEFEGHPSWTLQGEPKATKAYVGAGNYPLLLYEFKWLRQPRYFELNIIVPITLLLSVAAWLFWLPVESGEKIGLSMAVLIAFSVFHHTVLEHIPRTSQEMPALIVFVLVCMCMTTFSTMSACLIIHIGKGYEGSRIRAPRRLRNFTALLSRLFRMTADDPINHSNKKTGIELWHHEWRFIAAIADRFLFIIWISVCVIFGLAFAIYVHA